MKNIFGITSKQMLYIIASLNATNVYAVRNIITKFEGSRLAPQFIGYALSQVFCGYLLDRFNALSVLSFFGVISLAAWSSICIFKKYILLSYIALGIGSSIGFNFLSYSVNRHNNIGYREEINKLFSIIFAINTALGFLNQYYVKNIKLVYTIHAMVYLIVIIFALFNRQLGTRKEVREEVKVGTIIKQTLRKEAIVQNITAALCGLSVFGIAFYAYDKYADTHASHLSELSILYKNINPLLGLISFLVSINIDKASHFYSLSLISIVASLFNLFAIYKPELFGIGKESDTMLGKTKFILLTGFVTQYSIGLAMSNYIIAFGAHYPLYNTYMSAITNCFSMISHVALAYIDTNIKNILSITIIAYIVSIVILAYMRRTHSQKSTKKIV